MRLLIIFLLIPCTLTSAKIERNFYNGILRNGVAYYLKDITLSGSFADTTVCGRPYKDTTKIAISGSSGVTIQGYYIHNQTGTGVSLTNASGAIVQDNIIMNTTSHGIQLTGSSSSAIVRKNLIMYTGAQSVYANGNTGNNVHVDSNLCAYVDNGAGFAGVIQFNNSGNGNRMRANYVINDPTLSNGGDILNIINCVGTSGSHNLIENNYVTGYNGLNASAGVQVDQDCSYVDVTGNVLTSPGGKGIAVNGPNTSNVTVTSNKVYGPCVSGITNVGYTTGDNGGPCGPVTFTSNKGLWYCGRFPEACGHVCADNFENGSSFVGCSESLSGNDFSYDAMASEMQPPGGAQWAYDYWNVCGAGPTGIPLRKAIF